MIDLEYWAKDPEKPGYLKYTGSPTYGEVYRQLGEQLETAGMIDEYIALSSFKHSLDVNNTPFPRAGGEPEDRRWIAVYPVQGDSEGWYIHIDIIHFDSTRTMFVLIKTLAEDRNRAWEIAKAAGELLGA